MGDKIAVESKKSEVESKWITFIHHGASVSGKTLIWGVVAKDDGALLGEVRWFGPWRTYAFFPSDKTVYEPTCLRDIAAFITERTRSLRIVRGR